MTTQTDKDAVREFWDRASCGEIYATGDTMAAQLDAHARTRYELEPYIREFARFEETRGKDVLEIGIGMGADHLELARGEPKSLTGVDLTPRAVAFTSTRLATHGLTTNVLVADAEALPFPDSSFDLVYSWGVLHHSPDTPRAIREVFRVLRPGGRARVMIYHKWSMVGLMLWGRYALLAGRPRTSLAEVYAAYLESPGTKAYTIAETREMFAQFTQADVRTQLSFGDLLEGEVGQRHRGPVLSAVKKLWPRALIKRYLHRLGLFVMIDAVK